MTRNWKHPPGIFVEFYSQIGRPGSSVSWVSHEDLTQNIRGESYHRWNLSDRKSATKNARCQTSERDMPLSVSVNQSMGPIVTCSTSILPH